jgi:hypothetical protein
MTTNIGTGTVLITERAGSGRDTERTRVEEQTHPCT